MPATIVLVHGAFAESASWNGVIEELHPRGYRVISVANPLRGLQPDAAYLRSVLEHLSPGPIVVAGHSYGGSVMTEAAEGVPGVHALVYIASFNLDVGESTAAIGRCVAAINAATSGSTSAAKTSWKRSCWM